MTKRPERYLLGEERVCGNVIQFKLSSDGRSLKVSDLFVTDDERGGQDYERRTIAVFKLDRITKAGQQHVATRRLTAQARRRYRKA